MNRSDTLRSLADSAGLARAAIHVTGLTAGAWSAAADAGEPIYPASMVKTPLAVAAAAAVAAGRIGWADRVVITAANMTPNDAPSPLVAGAGAELSELVALMLSRSDNVATNVLFDVLDRDWATTAIAALGFPGTAFRRKLSGALPLIDDPAATGRNTHPPGEACALFARIARGSVPGAAFIADVLAAQYWNTKLSAGLAPGDHFAHKTGDTDEVSHDGGILSLASGEQYAIAVFTQLGSDEETDARFGVFMSGLRALLPT